MKILIGMDVSPHSAAVVEFMRKMTWPAGTEVIVVSAVPTMPAVYAELYVPSALEVERVMDSQKKIHEELVSRTELELRDCGLRTSSRVLIGDPRAAILDLAKGVGADLIVVGSHGRTGLSRLLMGSVASHIVAHAPCDVVVVRRKAGTA